MAELDEHGRPEPPLEAEEVTMLHAFLDYQRATLAWKCEQLQADGLRATVGASTMTLGGLLKHMALVEDSWFTRWLHGRDIGAPWNAVDWDADNDWEWNSAADDTPEQLRQLFFAIITRQAIHRGSFASVDDLTAAIRTYIDAYNQRCEPFTWTKTADEILTKLKPEM